LREELNRSTAFNFDERAALDRSGVDKYVGLSPMLVTALSLHIGYDNVSPADFGRIVDTSCSEECGRSSPPRFPRLRAPPCECLRPRMES
jgi:hypothetical protein